MAGVEPAMPDLQSGALPLGYIRMRTRAVCGLSHQSQMAPRLSHDDSDRSLPPPSFKSGDGRSRRPPIGGGGGHIAALLVVVAGQGPCFHAAQSLNHHCFLPHPATERVYGSLPSAGVWNFNASTPWRKPLLRSGAWARPLEGLGSLPSTESRLHGLRTQATIFRFSSSCLHPHVSAASRAQSRSAWDSNPLKAECNRLSEAEE